MDLEQFLDEHGQWAEETFGPGKRTEGIIGHLEKELKEIREHPEDPIEWIDLILIAFDGIRRQGYDPKHVRILLQQKFYINKYEREWPDWRKLEDSQNTVIGHIGNEDDD